MTTTVIIKSPKPNHHDVLVQLIDGHTGRIQGTIRVKEGEETRQYVYDGRELKITEISKEIVHEPGQDTT